MKVSRFEPHVLQPLADNNDIGTFLDDLEEQSKTVQPIETETQISDVVTHLNEFLKRKTKRRKTSKRAMAIAAYQAQNVSTAESPKPYRRTI